MGTGLIRVYRFSVDTDFISTPYSGILLVTPTQQSCYAAKLLNPSIVIRIILMQLFFGFRCLLRRGQTCPEEPGPKVQISGIPGTYSSVCLYLLWHLVVKREYELTVSVHLRALFRVKYFGIDMRSRNGTVWNNCICYNVIRG